MPNLSVYFLKYINTAVQVVKNCFTLVIPLSIRIKGRISLSILKMAKYVIFCIQILYNTYKFKSLPLYSSWISYVHDNLNNLGFWFWFEQKKTVTLNSFKSTMKTRHDDQFIQNCCSTNDNCS